MLGGPGTRLLALLAARLGRWEASFAHFEAAIARWSGWTRGPTWRAPGTNTPAPC